VSNCDGVYEASVKLDVPSFFIEQILRDEPVPDHVLDEIEQKIGPIRLTEQPSGFSEDSSAEMPGDILESETELEISIKEFVRNRGSLLDASYKLGVSTLTIQKLLSGVHVSRPTIKKVLKALKAVDYSIASDPPRSLLSMQHVPFKTTGSSAGLTHKKRGVYPSTIRKIQVGLPISEVTRHKLGISSEGSTTVCAPDHAGTSSTAALQNKLREIAKSNVDIFNLASNWGVTATSLRKIYDGKPISRFLAKKVARALSTLNPDLCNKPSAQVIRLQTIYNLYKQFGTLEAVGKQVGVTRERVRQLLTQGDRIGLFQYNPREYPFVSKEKIIEDYKKTLNLSRVAQFNNISTDYLGRLLTAYSISEQQLADYRLEGKRAKCIEEYICMVQSIGHHLSSGELQSHPTGRGLCARINRFWGSIKTFREELNIPAPRRIRPHWLEPWRQIALVKRMQHLDTIRDCMSTSIPVGVSELCQKSNFGPNRVRRLLALLMATGEINRLGQLVNTGYLLTR
jgi:hypothetical protein